MTSHNNMSPPHMVGPFITEPLGARLAGDTMRGRVRVDMNA